MLPGGWHTVGLAFGLLSAVLGLLALLRLKRLRSQGQLSPEMATYYAPLLNDPLFSIGIGGFSLRESQRQRMVQGRAIKLVISGDHAEIGDSWLTAWVWLNRVATVVMFMCIAAWLATGLG